MVIVSKEQELTALRKIKDIVDSLGENSYVATAFEGCFEIAEDNIRNDFVCSIKRKADNLQVIVDSYAEQIDSLKRTNEQLQASLEREEEWQEYEMPDNVKQSDYESLLNANGTRCLSEEETKEYLHKQFGFDPEYVSIELSVNKQKINRHGKILSIGAISRYPIYNATDWNYIRFNCGLMSYEVYNGELRFFLH